MTNLFDANSLKLILNLIMYHSCILMRRQLRPVQRYPGKIRLVHWHPLTFKQFLYLSIMQPGLPYVLITYAIVITGGIT